MKGKKTDIRGDRVKGKNDAVNSIRMTAATPSSSRSASGKWWLAGSRRCRSSASATTRRLRLAPEFGYGEAGDSDDIPPNATLIFKVGAAS